MSNDHKEAVEVDFLAIYEVIKTYKNIKPNTHDLRRYGFDFSIMYMFAQLCLPSLRPLTKKYIDSFV